MNFMEAVAHCFKNYVGFSGRASRSEFWWFMLLWVLCTIVSSFFGDVVSGIVALAFLLPLLAVQVRRLHDIGRTGWWILIGLIPIIGGLILLYFAVLPSQDGSNEYGVTAQPA